MEAFTNGDQLYDLFLSGGFGFLVGVYYDVFRVIRLLLPCRKAAVFVQDVVFFATTAAATFLFDMTLTGGQLRFYLFVGLIAGFLVYHVTLGRMVTGFTVAVLRMLLSAVWRRIRWWLTRPFVRLGRLLRRPCRFVCEKTRIFGKKVAEFFKKGLKQSGRVLYNCKCESVLNQDAGKAGGDREGDQIYQQKAQKPGVADRHSGIFGLYARHAGSTANGDRRTQKADRRTERQHPIPATAKRGHGKQE